MPCGYFGRGVAALIARAEFVQALYSKEGKPPVTNTTTFKDVKVNAWYVEAVSWAAETGIIAGKGDYFEPNEPITRQEVAPILYQYAQNIVARIQYQPETVLVGSDAGEITERISVLPKVIRLR